MGRAHARIVAALLLASAAPGQTAPWIITQYYLLSIDTIIPATTGHNNAYTDSGVFETETSVVKFPSGTPVAPDSTEITSYQSDITYVKEIYTQSVPGMSIPPNVYQVSYIDHYVNLVYKNPTSCGSSSWTFTTLAQIDAPNGVQGTSTTTVFDSITGIVLAPTVVPELSLWSLSSEYQPPWSDQCSMYSPATYYPNYPYDSNDYSDDGPDFTGCASMELDFVGTAIGGGYDCYDGMYWTWGFSLAGFICMWVFTWLGVFFAIGLLENWFTFRSLCCGHAARRGLPITWAFIIPFLTCFFLLASDGGYAAKPAEEQKRLQRRWDGLRGREAFREWWEWGFKRGYPPFLGFEPPCKGAVVYQYVYAAAPGMGQPGMQQPGMGQEMPYPMYPDPASPYPHQQAPYGAAPYHPPVSPLSTHASPYAPPGGPPPSSARSPPPIPQSDAPPLYSASPPPKSSAEAASHELSADPRNVARELGSEGRGQQQQGQQQQGQQGQQGQGQQGAPQSPRSPRPPRRSGGRSG